MGHHFNGLDNGRGANSLLLELSQVVLLSLQEVSLLSWSTCEGQSASTIHVNELFPPGDEQAVVAERKR